METNTSPERYNPIDDIIENRPEALNNSYTAQYMTKVYGWMFVALVVTAGIAFYTVNNASLMQMIFGSKFVFFGLMIAQLFLVGFLSIRIQKMSASIALLVFLGYAALNGFTFAVYLAVFSAASIFKAFGITAATFGIMTAVGYFTKTDLSSFGRILFMALIGVIIASLVNMFMHSPMLDWVISYLGVAIFVGLIAYDTQKIKAYAVLDAEEDRKRGAVIGALALYLDFINLFIFLLRIFGRRD